MPIYTKSVIATHQDPVDSVSMEYLSEIASKIEELRQAGKTDGEVEFLDEYRIKRIWLDQDAVDAWYAWLNPINTTHSVVITNVAVSDI
jgi:hypothetical protein